MDSISQPLGDAEVGFPDEGPSASELAHSLLSRMGFSRHQVERAMRQLLQNGVTLSFMNHEELAKQLLDEMERNGVLEGTPEFEEATDFTDIQIDGSPIRSMTRQMTSALTRQMSNSIPAVLRPENQPLPPPPPLVLSKSRVCWCCPRRHSEAQEIESEHTNHDSGNCPICLMPLCDGPVCSLPDCHHEYHEFCFKLFLRTEIRERMAAGSDPANIKCPECRIAVGREFVDLTNSFGTQEVFKARCREHDVAANPRQRFCPTPNCVGVLHKTPAQCIAKVFGSILLVMALLLTAAGIGVGISFAYGQPFPSLFTNAVEIPSIVLYGIAGLIGSVVSIGLMLARRVEAPRKWGWPAKCKHCSRSSCFECGNGRHAHSPCVGWELPNTRPCPGCRVPIEKVLRQNGGACNHITCRFCHHEFCWICMRPYTAGHFDGSDCQMYGGDEGTSPMSTSLKTQAFLSVVLSMFAKDAVSLGSVEVIPMLWVSALLLSGFAVVLGPQERRPISAKFVGLALGIALSLVWYLLFNSCGPFWAASWGTIVVELSITIGFWLAKRCQLRNTRHKSWLFCGSWLVSLALFGVAFWILHSLQSQTNAILVSIFTWILQCVCCSAVMWEQGNAKVVVMAMARYVSTMALMATLGSDSTLQNCWLYGLLIFAGFAMAKVATLFVMDFSLRIRVPISLESLPLPLPFILLWVIRVVFELHRKISLLDEISQDVKGDALTFVAIIPAIVAFFCNDEGCGSKTCAAIIVWIAVGACLWLADILTNYTSLIMCILAAFHCAVTTYTAFLPARRDFVRRVLLFAIPPAIVLTWSLVTVPATLSIVGRCVACSCLTGAVATWTVKKLNAEVPNRYVDAFIYYPKRQ